LVLPDWTPGPVIGAGGYLGALGRAWLEANFAHAGSLIFAFSLLVAGLLLATDYLMFQLAATTTRYSSRGLVQLGRVAKSTQRVKSDLETPINLDAEDEEEEYEEGEYEYEYEDEEEWEEEEVEE